MERSAIQEGVTVRKAGLLDFPEPVLSEVEGFHPGYGIVMHQEALQVHEHSWVGGNRVYSWIPGRGLRHLWTIN